MLVSGPHVIRGSLGPPESGTQMVTWLFQSFFARLNSVTHWQSDRKTDGLDRPRYSVRCGVIMRNYVGYGKANNFATTNLLSHHVIRGTEELIIKATVADTYCRTFKVCKTFWLSKLLTSSSTDYSSFIKVNFIGDKHSYTDTKDNYSSSTVHCLGPCNTRTYERLQVTFKKKLTYKVIHFTQETTKLPWYEWRLHSY